MISVTEALAFVTFTLEEQRALEKLEAVIDGDLVSKFNGAPLRFDFADEISPKIAAAIQRKYEAGGGWRVVSDLKSRALSFIPMFLPQSAKHEKKALPPITVQQTLVPVDHGQRLHVRMPTRSRPAQAIEALIRYRTMAGIPITIEVVIDEDDSSMLAPEVLQRLHALGCVITVGRHKSKVEAVNAGRVRDFDVLLLASDDMMPVVDGYAARALQAMYEHFPFLDGLVFFDDGYAHDRCCTLPIMGRRLLQMFDNNVYEPAYKSLCCDQEQTDVLSALGRIKYIDEKIIEHRHWVTGAPKDALYARNDALHGEDKALYEKRKRDNRSVCTWLSVCICSLPSRRSMLLRLYEHLWSQLRGCYVEILVDDREAVTIGEKRQALLERARGKFVCYVDDDDWVAHDYVERIISAVSKVPDADCVALNGVMLTAGEVPEPFYNSLKYTEWSSKDGQHYRTPTHLSPVRRELALKAGFVAKSRGEDHAYSIALRPLLKREVSAGEAPLYYYWYQPSKGAT